MKVVLTQIFAVISFPLLFFGCGVYSPYGAQTSGAKTYSVSAFQLVTPLASASSALALTEELRDRIQRQSTLRLVNAEGELQFAADITVWDVKPVNVQGDETAASNRLTIGLRLSYENTIVPDLSFERTFTRFADYTSDQDLLQIEDELVDEIGEQLSQDVFNATLGNW
ncbi:LPS assembly lipoprotein LptE [Flavobacteriales bacterium]|nr:LPS assembly lipoprotein LptE [Flavobacteriales bacterium]